MVKVVMTMPLFIICLFGLENYYKEEAKAIENAGKSKGTKTLITPDGKVNTPEFLKATKDYKGKTSYK